MWWYRCTMHRNELSIVSRSVNAWRSPCIHLSPRIVFLEMYYFSSVSTRNRMIHYFGRAIFPVDCWKRVCGREFVSDSSSDGKWDAHRALMDPTAIRLWSSLFCEGQRSILGKNLNRSTGMTFGNSINLLGTSIGRKYHWDIRMCFGSLNS